MFDALDPFGIGFTNEGMDRLLADILELTPAELEKRKAVWAKHRVCHVCEGPTVELFSTERPHIGYTGIYRCLVCDAFTDLTFKDGYFPNPYDKETL